MALDFPISPTEGQEFTVPGGPTYVYHAPVWDFASGGAVTIAWSNITDKPETFSPTLPIAWTDISGKPSTFAPTLPIAQSGVINLVADLAGKAPTVHTHAQSDITGLTTSLGTKLDLAGGVMTGAITAIPGSAAATGLHFGTPGTGLHGDASNVRIAAGGTNRMTIGTALTMAVTIRNTLGAVGTPGYSWASDTDAGIYLNAVGDMRLAMAGADVVKWLDDKTTTFFGNIAGPNIGTAVSRNLSVGTTAPASPAVNDLWVDTT